MLGRYVSYSIRRHARANRNHNFVGADRTQKTPYPHILYQRLVETILQESPKRCGAKNVHLLVSVTVIPIPEPHQPPRGGFSVVSGFVVRFHNFAVYRRPFMNPSPYIVICTSTRINYMQRFLNVCKLRTQIDGLLWACGTAPVCNFPTTTRRCTLVRLYPMQIVTDQTVVRYYVMDRLTTNQVHNP